MQKATIWSKLSAILWAFQGLFFLNRNAIICQLTNCALFVARCSRRDSACQVSPLRSFSVCKQFQNCYRRLQGFRRNLIQGWRWREPAQPIGRRFRAEDYSLFTERLTITGGCGGAGWAEDPWLNRSVVCRIILYRIPVCFCGQRASRDDLCICLCRILAGGCKGWSDGGWGGRWGSRIWFNQNLILQLNFVPGEEDVRQKRININNVFPSTLRVLNHPN